MAVEEHKAVVLRWVEVTNAKDLDGLDELFCDDTYDHVEQRTDVRWWKEVFTFPVRDPAGLVLDARGHGR